MRAILSIFFNSKKRQNYTILRFSKHIVVFVFVASCMFVNMSYVFAFTPHDPEYIRSAPFMEQIGAPQAWDITLGSRDVIVAVLDAGIDTDHEDLKQNIWINEDERMNGLDDDRNGYIDDLFGWDFVSHDNGVGPDTNGFLSTGIHHGTVVSGIIGASINNDLGSVGISPFVRIMPVKVMDNFGKGEVGDVIEGIRYAVNNGANIINLSFSGPESSEALKEALRSAHRAGVVVVVAAGNDNDKAESGNLDFFPKFPVCTDKNDSLDAVVGVGAVNRDDILAPFSNYGSCLDLVAPGVSMVSTLYHEAGSTLFNSTFGGYFSGTSLAAPLVSGSAALLKALHPLWSNTDIISALYVTADAIDFKNPSYIGKLGHGRLNLSRAMRVVFEDQKVVTTPQSNVPRVVETTPTKKSEPIRSGTLVVSPQSQGLGEVRIFDEQQGFVRSLQPFGSINDGLVFAVDDLDNNGSLEIVAIHNREVRIVNEFGVLLRTFMLRSGNTSTPSLAIGDIEGNTDKEIVVSYARGDAHVWLYTRQGYDLGQFLGTPLRVAGLSVAVGDVTNDGKAEIITTPTSATKTSDIWVYLFDGNLYTSINAYDNAELSGTNHDGFSISTADIDNDKRVELVIAPKSGTLPVRIFTHFGALINEFFPYGTKFRGGVSLSKADSDIDGNDEILIGAGAGGGPHVKIVDYKGQMKREWFVFDPLFRGGVNVGWF